MYDPDRAQAWSRTSATSARGRHSSERSKGPLTAQKAFAGRGHSYSHADHFFAHAQSQMQLRNFLAMYPQAKWHVYEPVNRDNVLEGAKLAFGQPVETRYDFSKADVIVSLDADFLYAGFPGTRATSATSPSAAIPTAQHEPPVRHREHAKFDRREGGSSACRCGQARSRSLAQRWLV
jgi:hypothetical protein